MTVAVVEPVTRQDFVSGRNPARLGAGDEFCLSAERPFPGLRPFAFADRTFFFGRERQAYALYRLVESARFIAVIGNSGSGKSSLISRRAAGAAGGRSRRPQRNGMGLPRN